MPPTVFFDFGPKVGTAWVHTRTVGTDVSYSHEKLAGYPDPEENMHITWADPGIQDKLGIPKGSMVIINKTTNEIMASIVPQGNSFLESEQLQPLPLVSPLTSF